MKTLSFLIAMVLLPGMALTCDQIGSRFQYCFDGGAWSGAEIESFGDGATYHLGDLRLDQIEPYAGRSDGPVEGDLAAQNDFFEITAEHVISTQAITMDGKTGIIQLRKDPYDPVLVASAIVVMDDARVLVWVTAPEDTDAELTLTRLNEAVAALELM